MARGKYVRAECDICGFAYSRSKLRKNSAGLLVCPPDRDWETSKGLSGLAS